MHISKIAVFSAELFKDLNLSLQIEVLRLFDYH